MKRAKKVSALFVAIIMILSFGLLSACNNVKVPEATQAEKDATAFIVLVDNLPANIAATETVDTAIKAAETAYAALSDTAKAVNGVSGAYAKLTAKRAAYNTAYAAVALATAKAEAILSLSTFVDSSKYTINSAELITAIALGTAAINNATDTAGVSAAVANAKATISLIKTDEQENEIAATITAIEVITEPTKMTYIVGQTFDSSGMVVSATFANGSTDENFTAYTVSPTTPLALGDTTITITVTENTSIKTTLTIEVSEKSELPTPSAGVFSINAASSAFEIDRDSALRTSSFEDLDYLKIYVYDSSIATEPVCTFKINFDYIAPSITLTPLTGVSPPLSRPLPSPLEINKASGDNSRYSYLSVTNLYVQLKESEPFMVAMIGESFDYGKAYYFKSQFVVKTGIENLDSQLSQISANGWKAAPLTVTFNSNGGNAVTTASVARGYLAEPPVEPTKINNTFMGWFIAADFSGETFDFALTAITSNITLNAKWESTGGTEKEKLGTVKLDGGTKNFMGNGSGLNPKAFTYNRGDTKISVGDWGEKVDHIKVTVYSAPEKLVEEASTQLLQFKIKGTGAWAGLIISSLDDSITHYAGINIDGYTGVSTDNAFIVAKYFSLFVNLIREKDANTIIADGAKLYFSFQQIAVSGSNYTDGDDSGICINESGRTCSVVSQADAETEKNAANNYDLGGTNSLAKNTAIVTFNTNGGTLIDNRNVLTGSVTQSGNLITVIPPTKSGFEFDGWYTDSELTLLFDTNVDKINANMKAAKTGIVTLYAKWTATV